MNIKTHFGNQVLARRKKLGLTQQQLADYLDVSRVNIVYIEKGINETSFANVWKLCCAFHCEPNDLFPPVKNAKHINKPVIRTVLVKAKVNKIVLK